MDDEKKADPPENIPGQIGNIGYKVTNLEGTKKGITTFNSYFYSLTGYKKGDEKKYLDIVDFPVEWKIK